MCGIVTTIWCLWFDIKLNYENNVNIESQCIDNNYGYDISQKQWLNYYQTESNITNITGVTIMNYDIIEGDSFGDDLNVSERFMLAVFTSFFLGVFLWQPLTLLIKSLLKLRSLIKNPDQVNEAFLLFDKKNLVDLNQLKQKQKQVEKNLVVMNQQSLKQNSEDHDRDNDNDADEQLQLDQSTGNNFNAPAMDDGKSTGMMYHDDSNNESDGLADLKETI